MAFPSNIDRRIAELLDIVDRDFEVNVSSDVQELLRGLLEIRRLASKADVDLQYIEPKVAFALGTDSSEGGSTQILVIAPKSYAV
jgi:hypothetical protein